ncbi:hypothetical protein Tco_0992390 [Tanacetum coccineum]|uniref:Uncharacterized protein n=1 Tax=Tanacetum coccineum TaxID=301880 RepID=A0ABQ5F1Y6_9ASTR
MESVKKSIDERAQHKREYDSRVNDRQMQTTEEKVDTRNDEHADIRPIYDEEPMVEVQTTAEINVFATGQQHTEQPEFNNEGEGFKEFSSDEQAMTSDHNSSKLRIYDHSNELSSLKLVPKIVPPVDKTSTSRQELENNYSTHINIAEVNV